MTEKVIHVDAYTRSDGTYVHEHERHINTDNNYSYSTDENVSNRLYGKVELSNYLQDLKNDFTVTKNLEAELLEKLGQIGVGDQSGLLNKYAEIKDKNTNFENLINTIEYSLNEESKEKLKKAQKDKEYLDRLVGFTGYGPFDDAGQFWNMSSNGFDNEKAEKYIAKNGKIYSQIDELPVNPEIKKAVRNKVKQQLQKDDLVGVCFHKDSSIAHNISRDIEFTDIINKNFVKLLRNEHINASMNFSDDLNLAKALGKVDILDMHINKDGDIEAYVLDTYDFNKNSTDKMVQKGYNAQEHNLINNYYTLIKVIKKL